MSSEMRGSSEKGKAMFISYMSRGARKMVFRVSNPVGHKSALQQQKKARSLKF